MKRKTASGAAHFSPGGGTDSSPVRKCGCSARQPLVALGVLGPSLLATVIVVEYALDSFVRALFTFLSYFKENV